MAEANGVLCQVSHSLHWTAAAKVLDAKELDIALTLRAMAETNGVPFQDTGPFRSILLRGCQADGEDTGPYKSIQLRGCRADVECLCCEEAGFVRCALVMAIKAAGLRRRPAGAQGAPARRGARAGPRGGGGGTLGRRAVRPRRAPPPARALAMRAPPTPCPAPRPGPADGSGRRGGDGPRDRDRRGRQQPGAADGSSRRGGDGPRDRDRRCSEGDDETPGAWLHASADEEATLQTVGLLPVLF